MASQVPVIHSLLDSAGKTKMSLHIVPVWFIVVFFLMNTKSGWPVSSVDPARSGSSVLTLNPTHVLSLITPKDSNGFHAKWGLVTHTDSPY